MKKKISDMDISHIDGGLIIEDENHQKYLFNLKNSDDRTRLKMLFRENGRNLKIDATYGEYYDLAISQIAHTDEATANLAATKLFSNGGENNNEK